MNTKTQAVAYVMHPDGTVSHRNLKTTVEYGRHEVAFAVVETRRNHMYADWLRSNRVGVHVRDNVADTFLSKNQNEVSYSVTHWTKSEKSAHNWVSKQTAHLTDLNINDVFDYVIVHVEIAES